MQGWHSNQSLFSKPESAYSLAVILSLNLNCKLSVNVKCLFFFFFPPQEEECQHEYEVNCLLRLPQHLGAHIKWSETGTCLLPNCFLGQDEAKEEPSDVLEPQ